MFVTGTSNTSIFFQGHLPIFDLEDKIKSETDKGKRFGYELKLKAATREAKMAKEKVNSGKAKQTSECFIVRPEIEQRVVEVIFAHYIKLHTGLFKRNKLAKYISDVKRNIYY